MGYAYSAVCILYLRQGHVEYYRKANANRKNSYTNMHTIIIRIRSLYIMRNTVRTSL